MFLTSPHPVESFVQWKAKCFQKATKRNEHCSTADRETLYWQRNVDKPLVSHQKPETSKQGCKTRSKSKQSWDIRPVHKQRLCSRNLFFLPKMKLSVVVYFGSETGGSAVDCDWAREGGRGFRSFLTGRPAVYPRVVIRSPCWRSWQIARLKKIKTFIIFDLKMNLNAGMVQQTFLWWIHFNNVLQWLIMFCNNKYWKLIICICTTTKGLW